MRQGTTPSYTVTVCDRDLRDKTVYVTLRDQKGRTVTKTGSDLSILREGTDSVILFRLTQQETFDLSLGKSRLQVRYVDGSGEAEATDIAEIKNLGVLLDGIIPLEDGE